MTDQSGHDEGGSHRPTPPDDMLAGIGHFRLMISHSTSWSVSADFASALLTGWYVSTCQVSPATTKAMATPHPHHISRSLLEESESTAEMGAARGSHAGASTLLPRRISGRATFRLARRLGDIGYSSEPGLNFEMQTTYLIR